MLDGKFISKFRKNYEGFDFKVTQSCSKFTIQVSSAESNIVRLRTFKNSVWRDKRRSPDGYFREYTFNDNFVERVITEEAEKLIKLISAQKRIDKDERE